jgi:hypothetical protein
MVPSIHAAETLTNLIQPEKLAAHGFLRPQSISLAEGTDHSGEAAYYVFLVYPDSTPDDQLAWSKVKPMVQWVRNAIRAATAEERWPYVRVVREADVPSLP